MPVRSYLHHLFKVTWGDVWPRYSITSTLYHESMNCPAPSRHSTNTVRPSAELSQLTTLQVAKVGLTATCTCSVRPVRFCKPAKCMA